MRRPVPPQPDAPLPLLFSCRSFFCGTWILLASCGDRSPSKSEFIAVRSEPPRASQKPIEPDRSQIQVESPTKAETQQQSDSSSKPTIVSEPPPRTPKDPLSTKLSKVLKKTQHPSLTLIVRLENNELLGHAQKGFESDSSIIEQSRWAPASTVKPLLAWQALENGTWSKTQEVDCRGAEANAFGKPCFARHNFIDLPTAIAKSCNLYFFALADRIGRSGVIQSFKKIGFDTESITESNWQESALGHGSLLVTPLQIADAYRQMTLALQQDPRLLPIRNGLERAIHDPQGTAHGPASASIPIMGKTGIHRSSSSATSSNVHWFAGIAPRDEPQVVVVSLVENDPSKKNQAITIAAQSIKAWESTRQ